MIVSEYWRLLTLLTIFGVVGFFLDQLFLGLFLGASVYLVRHLSYIRRLSKWLLQKKAGETPEGTGIWLDIFERIHALQKRNKNQKIKLAAAVTRFQEAASAMPDAMVILSGDYKIEWFNQAAKRLLGLRSPQDIGQVVTNLFRNPTFSKFLNSNQETSIEGIDIVSPGDEALVLHLRLAPYGKGKALLVARDVTHINHLEQVRKNFVANVSHELRTPLTVLSGYLEAISMSPDANENPWYEPMQQMYSQSTRMQGIVKDLLLLTRLENFSDSIEGEPVDVGTIIEMLLEEARVLGHEKKQSLTADYDSSLKIRGKQEDLQSAFSNLVSNAVRYTPDKGKIHIKWYADEAGAHFAVEDTGMGVSEMDIPRLTERFFRVDEARSRETGGTGLGLAIVKHVLLRHDARLSVTSKLGQGSRFCCDFPESRIVKPSFDQQMDQLSG
ncbi:MAG: phosphate regulon sensor histidine kinase PhoR [Gammaproteobacteria bacterium]|nr:phosphate regulon sensor histidine kinase PhoR [Gammaproteobacteria bacterium]